MPLICLFIPTKIVSIYCSALVKNQKPPGGVVQTFNCSRRQRQGQVDPCSQHSKFQAAKADSDTQVCFVKDRKKGRRDRRKEREK